MADQQHHPFDGDNAPLIALSYQPFERIETKLRPRFQRIAARDQFFFVEKRDVCDHRLALFHFRLGQFENVNDTEMDLTDFGAVVI